MTDATYRTPSANERAGYRFTLPETAAVLSACRAHNVTFGTVIPVISQLALTRMVHRRYLRGEMSQEEWEDRRRQPMHFTGPLNLRPFMDEEWQKKGGATEIALAIDFYECTLPFMPTPFDVRRDESVPDQRASESPVERGRTASTEAEAALVRRSHGPGMSIRAHSSRDKAVDRQSQCKSRKLHV